jgi:hypothetical protein
MSESEGAGGIQRYRFHLIVGLLGLLIVVVTLANLSRRERASMAGLDVGEMSSMRMQASPKMGGGGRGGGGGGALAGGGMAQLTPAQPVANASQEAGFEPTRTALSAWPVNPMLIRTASLQMRVEDVSKAHAHVASIARAAGGYVASSTLNAESGPTFASIVIRVPNEGLDSALDQIAALGKLLKKQISAQEVTEEYVDLTSRRRNLQREELRLLDLLERAGKIRDLLEVEQEIGRIRGEIETISGRLRYLENRVSLSTITVQLEGPQPKPRSGGPVWTARDVARQATRSLIGAGQSLATMAIWIGIFSPVWLLIAVVLAWVTWRSRGAFRQR